MDGWPPARLKSILDVGDRFFLESFWNDTVGNDVFESTIPKIFQT